MMKKKRRDYSKIRYDDLPKVQEPRDRKVIKSRVVIDRGCFRKTDEEKLRLKLEKARDKQQISLGFGFPEIKAEAVPFIIESPAMCPGR